MFETDERNTIRQHFFNAYQKHIDNVPCSALETLLIEIILSHPEYETVFQNPNKYLGKEFFPELGDSNPFLHMGAHISIREQHQTNRPKGIKHIYAQLVKKYKGNAHQAEHQMMEVMISTLHMAQQNQLPPDEQLYLKKCRKLLK